MATYEEIDAKTRLGAAREQAGAFDDAALSYLGAVALEADDKPASRVAHALSLVELARFEARIFLDDEKVQQLTPSDALAARSHIELAIHTCMEVTALWQPPARFYSGVGERAANGAYHCAIRAHVLLANLAILEATQAQGELRAVLIKQAEQKFQAAYSLGEEHAREFDDSRLVFWAALNAWQGYSALRMGEPRDAWKAIALRIQLDTLKRSLEVAMELKDAIHSQEPTLRSPNDSLNAIRQYLRTPGPLSVMAERYMPNPSNETSMGGEYPW